MGGNWLWQSHEQGKAMSKELRKQKKTSSGTFLLVHKK
jgi:hypothetical protein